MYIDVDMLLSSFGLINVFLDVANHPLRDESVDAAMKRSISVLWLRDSPIVAGRMMIALFHLRFQLTRCINPL